MNILHLSDLHFGRNNDSRFEKSDFFNKKKIMNELLELFKEITVEDRPHHIVVTGDIAWKGKKSEFEEAFIWFEQLLQVLNLSGDDISFCVGNHDINRGVCVQNIDVTDVKARKMDELYSYENIFEYEPIIYNYNDFCETVGMEPYKYITNGHYEYSYTVGYKDVPLESGEKLRLLSFNTSMVSLLNSIAHDKMWIGLPQIKTLLDYGVIPTKDFYSIALFHHAERFLSPDELCEYDGRLATLPLLRKNIDLCLCGHTETGGLPVLVEQKNGGKLLTAGATYYSDSHPNSFTILKISDKKNLLVIPFCYKNGWQKMFEPKKEYEVKEVKEPVQLGDIIQNCLLVFDFSDGSNYSLPIKRLLLQKVFKDGELYIKISNKKEVTRHLDIVYEGPASGGKSNTIICTARNMRNNIESMLYIDLLFDFVHKKDKQGIDYSISIHSENGDFIVQGVKAKINIPDKYLPESIDFEIINKLILIEKYFDVKLLPPKEVYESELCAINCIVDLIQKGCFECDGIGSTVSTALQEKEKIEQALDLARNNKKFVFYTERECDCHLFENKFSIGKIGFISGKYIGDIDEWQRKVESFEEHDRREFHFQKSGNEKTRAFFVDTCRLSSENDVCLIKVNDLPVNLDFIRFT